MTRTRTGNLRLIIITTAVTICGAVFVTQEARGAGARPADPGARVQCDGSTFDIAFYDYGAGPNNAATPGQLADGWASRERPDKRHGTVTQRPAFKSDVREDVVFEHAGRVVAALTFERHSETGWRLSSTAQCLPSGGQR